MAVGTSISRFQDVPLDKPLGKVPPGYLRSLCPASTCSSFQSTSRSSSISTVEAHHRGGATSNLKEPRLCTIQEKRIPEVRATGRPGPSVAVDQQRFPSLHPCHRGSPPFGSPISAAGKPSMVSRPPGTRATSAPAGARSHVTYELGTQSFRAAF